MEQEIVFPNNVDMKELFELTENVLLVSGHEGLSFKLEEFEGLRSDHRFLEFQKVAEENPSLEILSFYKKDPAEITASELSDYHKTLCTIFEEARTS